MRSKSSLQLGQRLRLASLCACPLLVFLSISFASLGQGALASLLPKGNEYEADSAFLSRLSQQAIAYSYARNREFRVLDSSHLAQLESLTIMAVGDIMLGSDYPSKTLLPPSDDPNAILAAARETLLRGDVVFGNLEGPLGDGIPPAKSCRNPDQCYLFRVPTRYAGTLKSAGFTHLSLANNHMGDFGALGRSSTLRVLDSLDIAAAGLLARPVIIKIINGKRVGLCAFAPNSGTSQLNDYANLRAQVRALRDSCDIVMASCHMGAEGRGAYQVTRTREVYLGENRGNPYEIARVLIDAGADIVIGHGPHVPRALECYKGKLIIYSLGNFCTYGRISLAGTSGYAPLVEVTLDAVGNLVRGRVHSFIQRKPFGLLRDSTGTVARHMEMLTRRDFPEKTLRFDEDGWFYPN